MAQKIEEEKAEEIIHLSDTAPKKIEEKAENSTPEDSKNADLSNEKNTTSPQQEEEMVKKKYGGLLTKKPPLISKDNERAFFDSADWALGKVGVPKSKGPLEALRPKLQPTRHQLVRCRSAYAPTDDGEDVINSDNLNPGETQSRPLDNDIESNNNSNHSSDNQNPPN